MSQVNLNSDDAPATDARTSATNNLTWAIAMVLIIAAIAVAVVFVGHQAHLF